MKKGVFAEIPEELNAKLERLIASEKYASKVDFILCKIKEEPE